MREKTWAAVPWETVPPGAGGEEGGDDPPAVGEGGEGGEGGVADRVDAPVETDEATCADEHLELAAGEPQRVELRAARDAVLSRREAGEQNVERHGQDDRISTLCTHPPTIARAARHPGRGCKPVTLSMRSWNH